MEEKLLTRRPWQTNATVYCERFIDRFLLSGLHFGPSKLSKGRKDKYKKKENIIISILIKK